ncbi:MAG: sulfur carrier protein ThiS [Gammaproteobacteria bacterium]
MEIIVNGEAREVDDSLSAAQLLEALGLAGQRVAVEINLEIVPRSEFEQHRLSPGDRVEVVRAIGGG